MHRLSFLYDPMELLCDRLPAFYKQCQSFTGIRSLPNGSIEAIHYRSGKFSRELVRESLHRNLNSYLDGKRKMDWLTEDEHPLYVSRADIVQLDISRELERTILMLSPSFDKAYGRGILLLHIDSGISQFGITRQNRKLLPEDRTMIGTLLLQFCESTLDLRERDRQLYLPLTKMKSHLQSELHDMQRELDLKDRNLAKGLIEYADHILVRLGEQFRTELKLTRRAYEKIGAFGGKFNELEDSLAQSVSIAVNSNLVRSSELILDESDIFLLKDTVDSIETAPDQAPVVGRLTKTHQLLDKYEDAARQAQRNGESIIGRVIGKYCEPPISNAAITDSLNNHADRVWELMKKYPDKWPVIRNHFRSIINLVGRYNSDLEEDNLHTA